MPNSNLFAVSNQGRVFALQTDHTRWEELPYLGIDFKRISAHDTVVWALGGDHQVYVYVYGTSVPIRVCEESYENQRWNPIEGFTSNLLPSDRHGFSNIDGLEKRNLPDIHLPSLAWNWEGPWHLQDTYEGKVLDKECWTYAVDFPRSFMAEKTWKSCVRRRKWVRYRRYIALDTWSAVSSIHKDQTQEPFIDIAVGGGDVIGEDSDRLMVWAITAFGKVVVREGICATCPEGTKWTFVSMPPNQDATCLSVSRSGRVWVLTWDGSALVRTGVSRECPLGVGWAKVEPPGSPMNQIAVGNSVVWVVCRDSTVWFRRGLDDEENGTCGYHDKRKSYHDNADFGTSWLQMIGSLQMVSVGPNNQVWGITSEEYSLVIRTGVTSSELTGKMWKVINLPLQRFDPNRQNPGEDLFDRSSTSDDASCGSSPLQKGSRASSVVKGTKGSSYSLNLDAESQDAVSMNTDILGSECSGHDTTPSSSLPKEPMKAPPSSAEGSSDGGEGEEEMKKCRPAQKSSPIVIGQTDSEGTFPTTEFNSLKIRYPDEVSDSMTSSVISDTVVNFIGSDYQYEDTEPDILKSLKNGSANGDEKGGNRDESQLDSKDGSEQVVDSQRVHSEQVVSEYGCQQVVSQVDWSVPLGNFERRSNGGSLSSVSSESFVPAEDRGSISQEERPIFILTLPEENLWMWVSGNGCWVQSLNMPKCGLFVFGLSRTMARIHFGKLYSRKKEEVEKFKSYVEAIECPSWVVNGQCRYLVAGHWVPATLELQMVGSKACQVQEAFLKIIYTLGSKKTTLIPCCSIVLSTLIVDLPAKALVSLYTPTQPLQPIPLLFSAEKDAEQWLNHISMACIQFRGVDNRPSANAMWAVSSLGFIYFHDPSSSETELRVESRAAHCSLDLGDGSTPSLHPFERGFRPGCFITVKGKVHESAKRFHIDLMVDETSANIALHLNPRFNDKVVVMNTREHNVWSYEEKEPLKPFARGKEFEVTILCDDRDMKISVNGKLFYCFNHRVMPWDITHLCVVGDVTIYEIIYNYGAGERTLCEYFWRGVGGHLRVVEAGAGGVTWGISYDAHVYTYTGVCGGGIFKGNASDPKVNVMSDMKHFHVWENQRWNPLTGFTYRGLPTDRKTWSDQSGRHERTKEGTKLPSRHWQWIGDWTVDHHTPNGADKDGWQYATDFPMSYHAHRYVTDLVRRRRWVRKCRISTSGPWKQMEKVSLISVSVSPEYSENGTVPVWGVSVSNEVVMREGVTPQCPRGTRWSLIPSETPMKEISASIEGGVWAVSMTGQGHLRIGTTKTNPKGYDWVNIDAPDVPLKQVGIGSWKVWALDRDGYLYHRLNVQPLFPEGTAWEKVCGNVESISVGADGSLGAVLQYYPHSEGSGDCTGVIATRKGVSKENPGGTGWDICTGTGWSHLSARIPVL